MRFKFKASSVNSQKGLSLVELLIAVILTVIMGSAMLDFYISQHNQFLVQEEISDMRQNGRVAMDEITKNIRKAGYGLTGQPSISVGTDTLKVYFKDGSQTDTIVYYISRADTLHSNLMKKVGSGAAQVFAENIDSLRFTQSEKLIHVRIVAREDTKDDHFHGDKYHQIILSSNVEVRNSL
jgi:type IV pilus assembly protein PilW